MKSVKHTVSSLVLFAVLLSTGSAAFAANLLVNGGFEQPGCSGDCVLNTPAQASFITGWTTFLSGVEYINLSSQIPGSAAEGVDIVDLANYIYPNGGGIQQNFATTVGARYRLTFSAGNSTLANRTGSGVIQVKVAGNMVSFNTPTATSAITVWDTVTYDFTATTPQTTLSFSNEQDPASHFAFLDKVSVEPL